MSGEIDLCRGSDPGNIAYLQTRSSNTSGQVISYTLIRRDNLISPIKEQHYDLLGLILSILYWTSQVNLIWTCILKHPSLVSAKSHGPQRKRKCTTTQKNKPTNWRTDETSEFSHGWVKPNPTQPNVCLPGHLFSRNSSLSEKQLTQSMSAHLTGQH